MTEGNKLQFSIWDEETFSSENFSDTRRLKEYLHRQREEDFAEEAARFDFIAQIVAELSQLRFEAEDEQKHQPNKVKNRRKELPVSWQSIAHVLSDLDSDEPEQRLITRIAQEHIGIVESLARHMRHVLHRERKMVSLANAQQLDTQCLRWLTRQPGRTAEEKAGHSQHILAVVREENLNTLENRVLKDFFRYCQRATWEYQKQFRAKYSQSQRLRDVNRFHGLCQSYLTAPEMEQLPLLSGMPVPNYVLQYDARYSQMWEWYRQLVQQMRMVEFVWPYRHKLFTEYVLFRLLCLFRFTFQDQWTPFYANELWLHAAPEKGLFFHCPFWFNLFRAKETPQLELLKFQANSLTATPSFVDFALQFSRQELLRGGIRFIPVEAPDIIHLPSLGPRSIYFVYSENPTTQIVPDSTCHIVRLTTFATLPEEMKQGLKDALKDYHHYAH